MVVLNLDLVESSLNESIGAKGACEQQNNIKTNLLTYGPLLGYECSFWGLPETRDGQVK
jgi:hypothetical protein